MLGASIGNRIQGYYCATDIAFEDLKRYVRYFSENPVWSVCISQIEIAEHELESLDGISRETAEEVLNEASHPGNWDKRYERAFLLLEEMDDFASAVFVILGSRLRGVSEAVNHVREKSGAEGIATIKGRHSFDGDMRLVGQVGNFAKHGDEWGEELSKLQRHTLDALIELGVATNDSRDRFTNSWVASSCALKLGKQATLSGSLREVIAMCCHGVDCVPSEVQREFESLEQAIEAKRRELQPSQKIRVLPSAT